MQPGSCNLTPSNAFSGSIANSATALIIGRDMLQGYHFGGRMDELRLWNVARSPGQIVSNMNRTLIGSESGLVAYWRFENSAANNAALTGSACDGSLVNAPGYVLSGAPFVPDASALPASAIGRTNATLNGTVNPGNLATAAWFQWGMDTNYGNVAAITNLSATNANLSVVSTLRGLTPGHTYHCQLVASNSAGVVMGSNVTWTNLILPPTATTLAVTSVLFTNATLKAAVNPNSLATTVWFEWGPDTNYGGTLGQTNLSAGNADVALAAVLAGLSRG